MARSLLLGAAVASSLLGCSWANQVMCYSSGDTHVKTFDNHYYDVMWAETTLMSRSNDGFFEVQVTQTGGSWITWIYRAAVRCGRDVIAIYSNSDVRLNNVRMATSPATQFPAKYTAATRPLGSAGIISVERHGWTTVRCNRGFSLDEPGTFVFQYAHSTAYVYVDRRTYGPGDFTGMCGWRPPEQTAQMNALGCFGGSFRADQCRRLLVPTGPSFFHAAPSNTPVEVTPQVNAATFQLHRDKCETAVRQVAPTTWTNNQPTEFTNMLQNIVRDCAYDAVYGMASPISTLKELVCRTVDGRAADLRKSIAEHFKTMRCLFSYEHAMFQNGTANFRYASEDVVRALENARFELKSLCLGGACECKASPAVPDTPLDAPCAALPTKTLGELKARMLSWHFALDS